jgi:hypothetical protein
MEASTEGIEVFAVSEIGLLPLGTLDGIQALRF